MRQLEYRLGMATHLPSLAYPYTKEEKRSGYAKQPLTLISFPEIHLSLSHHLTAKMTQHVFRSITYCTLITYPLTHYYTRQSSCTVHKNTLMHATPTTTFRMYPYIEELHRK